MNSNLSNLRCISFLAAVHVILVLSNCSTTFAYPFRDVSIQAGLDYSLGPRKKYGGACVADLNGDGYQDLLLGHHDDKYTEIYLGSRNGKFRKLPWRIWNDIHAFVPFRANPYNRRMMFMMFRGGSYGLKPTPPLIFMITKWGRIVKKKEPVFPSGRGRTAVFLPLHPIYPAINQAIIINAAAIDRRKPHVFAAKVLPSGDIRRIWFSGMEKDNNWFAAVTDIDNDRRMEVITFQDLRIYKNTRPFKVTDISAKVFPRYLLPIRGVVAVAELDYDGDGYMDLYVARTVTSDLKWLRLSRMMDGPSDFLFRNVGGRYVDVTRKARIPLGGESRGVTTGDFNNDGLIDIFVTQFKKPHRLLMNKGDGTFRVITSNFGRRVSSHGDAPVAVDYNQDGKLDLILSEGDFLQRANGGQYRIMKNIGAGRNYLLVRVGSSPKRIAVSLYAVATVRVGGRSMIRRVGSPGTAISVSYIELLHFGLGWARTAHVTVRWTDGAVQTMRNVKANSLVQFGRI